MIHALQLARAGAVGAGVLTVGLLGTRDARPQPSGMMPPGAVAEILAVHQAERRSVGVPPLRWDDDLAASALHCAQRLAASRQFRHCRSGENLWLGSTGRFSTSQMAELWARERRDFQPGIFPAVSRSGNWRAVGHYTQMVWRTTTALGCATASGADGLTRLVCHYAPPGNIIGRPVI